jgi:hypothetical protein
VKSPNLEPAPPDSAASCIQLWQNGKTNSAPGTPVRVHYVLNNHAWDYLWLVTLFVVDLLPLFVASVRGWTISREELTTNNYKIPTTNNVANDSIDAPRYTW